MKTQANYSKKQFEYTLPHHYKTSSGQILVNARVSFADLDKNGSIDSNTEILQTQSYYPFGLTHSGLQSPKSGQENLYQYNGKETELELTAINYDWRIFDPAIARWGVMDGASEGYASHSPYGFVANNPIRNVEIDGNVFTPESWEHLNDLIEEVNNRQERNNSRIAEKRAQIESGTNKKSKKLSDKKISNLQKQVGNLEQANTRLEEVKTEIDIMEASDQVYSVFNDNSLDEQGAIQGTGSDVSYTSFNFSTGVMEIGISSNSSLAHELKHAYQFEIGEYSVGPEINGSFKNLLYDKYDEVDAYYRGSLFGETAYGVNNLPKRYDNVQTGPVSHSDIPTLRNILTLESSAQKKAFQGLANATGHAFRINGVTYYRMR